MPPELPSLRSGWRAATAAIAGVAVVTLAAWGARARLGGPSAARPGGEASSPAAEPVARPDHDLVLPAATPNGQRWTALPPPAPDETMRPGNDPLTPPVMVVEAVPADGEHPSLEPLVPREIVVEATPVDGQPTSLEPLTPRVLVDPGPDR